MFSPLIQRHGTTQLGEVNPQFDVPYNRMDATWGKQIICARGEECTIKIWGVGLQQNDSLAIIDKGTCTVTDDDFASVDGEDLVVRRPEGSHRSPDSTSSTVLF